MQPFSENRVITNETILSKQENPRSLVLSQYYSESLKPYVKCSIQMEMFCIVRIDKSPECLRLQERCGN
jgi:hypothetical protein